MKIEKKNKVIKSLSLSWRVCLAKRFKKWIPAANNLIRDVVDSVLCF